MISTYFLKANFRDKGWKKSKTKHATFHSVKFCPRIHDRITLANECVEFVFNSSINGLVAWKVAKWYVQSQCYPIFLFHKATFIGIIFFVGGEGGEEMFKKNFLKPPKFFENFKWTTYAHITFFHKNSIRWCNMMDLSESIFSFLFLCLLLPLL